MIPEPRKITFHLLLLTLFCFTALFAHAQQDLELKAEETFLKGKNVIKVKRDFADPYLWALTDDNEVYRLNSVTKTVDNYTEKFKAYNHLKFIDIAGISKDTMFVATNTDVLLELRHQDVKVINAAYGIRGNINSIGHDYRNHEVASEIRGFSIYLLIATNHGFCRYNFIEDKMMDHTGAYDFASKVFESSNRNLMTNDNFEHLVTEGADNYSVMLFIQTSGVAGSVVYLNNTIGRTVRTAYYVGGNLDYRYDSGRINQYWATENGLFVNNLYGIRNANSNIMSYLPGIQINKITSILGLTAFKNTLFTFGLHRENILIAANNGLYFSNSAFKEFVRAGISKHSFYRYTPLNGKKINDISVNSLTYYDANYSYYYGRYCEDKIWVAAVDGLYLLRPDYSRFLNTQTLNDLVFKDKPGVNEVTLCGNVNEKAVINGYNEMIYEWYRNDIKIEGENKNELDIKTDGIYKAILYDPCSGAHVKTNTLTVTQTASPTFTFNYPDQINICDKQPYTLTATGSAAYAYRWFKDNAQLNITSNTLSVTESGNYRVEVSACSGSWVPSKTVQVNLITVPAIKLTTNKAAYCNGDNATLSINTSASNDYIIRWWHNGDPLIEAIDKTSIITNKPGNYNVTIEGRNVAACTQVSNMLPLAFSPQPALSIQQIVNTTLCEGATVELRALHPADINGIVTWSSGQTGEVLRVTRSDTYTAELRTPAGCTVSESINVTFLPNPVLNLADAELCPYDNESVTLTAPAGYVNYLWNGQQGGASYTVNSLGNINLTVTDFNGCTATQLIKVTNKCDNIRIPNTFTPNGDGINDTWNISGIQGNSAIAVKVYNRNGALVFESSGYPIPWDGTARGQQLPVGSYYYIISVKNSGEVLSGSVTILR